MGRGDCTSLHMICNTRRSAEDHAALGIHCRGKPPNCANIPRTVQRLVSHAESHERNGIYMSWRAVALRIDGPTPACDGVVGCECASPPRSRGAIRRLRTG